MATTEARGFHNGQVLLTAVGPLGGGGGVIVATATREEEESWVRGCFKEIMPRKPGSIFGFSEL